MGPASAAEDDSCLRHVFIRIILVLLIVISAFCCPILITTPQAAEIYKWVDDKGKIHFGDKPATPDAEVVDIRNSPRTNPTYQDELDKQLKLLDVMQEERLENENEKNRLKQENEVRRENCLKVKKILGNMKNARYIYQSTDDPDNPHILSDEDRKTETARMESEVKRWCD